MSAAATVRGRLHRGLVASPPTPCLATGSIAWEATAAYAASLLREPLVGVAVGPLPGRPPADDAAWLELWLEASQAAGKLCLVRCDPLSDETEEPAAWLRDELPRLAGLGVAAVLLEPPLPEVGAGEAAWYEAAAAGPLPLVPVWRWSGGDRAVWRALLAAPATAAVLVESGLLTDLQEVAGLVKDEFGELPVLTGHDRHLAADLLAGAVGAVLAAAAVWPRPLAALLQDAWDGHWPDFVARAAMLDLAALAAFPEDGADAEARLLELLHLEGRLPDEAVWDATGQRLAADAAATLRWKAGAVRGGR
ncbi:MAG: hypothetical protein IT204_09300 [Fimbriimonadaceae bacterium]|nr:hypothetical protein [Fimbriimonadaceae bacterium]